MEKKVIYMHEIELCWLHQVLTRIITKQVSPFKEHTSKCIGKSATATSSTEFHFTYCHIWIFGYYYEEICSVWLVDQVFNILTIYTFTKKLFLLSYKLFSLLKLQTDAVLYQNSKLWGDLIFSNLIYEHYTYHSICLLQ